MKYITIRADIRDSRTNLKYNLLKELLIEVREETKRYDIKTLVDLEIRGGDELFGVYPEINQFIDVFTTLISAAKTLSIPLYVGIGYGELDVISSDSMMVNGVSIWEATDALSYVKKNSRKYNIQVNDLLSFQYSMKNEKMKRLISNMFFLYLQKIYERTEQQNLAISIFEKYQKDMSKADMYQYLTNRFFKNYSESEGQKMSRLFDKFLERANYSFLNDIKENIIYLIDEVSIL